mmetsp:Transcript_44552/g.123404  ORF Transcript_44552/g.123404 Transcript_44552/m.123404 type:complete len:654 (-) Transcript_44552:62-2023(-)
MAIAPGVGCREAASASIAPPGRRTWTLGRTTPRTRGLLEAWQRRLPHGHFARQAQGSLGLGTATALGAVALGAVRSSRRRQTRGRRIGCDPCNQSGPRNGRLAATALRAAAAFDVSAWRAGFRDAEEHPDGYYFLEDVPDLPADLSGSLFCVGPGKFSVEGEPLRHQLDGDGVVLGVSFNGGKVCVRQRFVQTQGLLRDALKKRLTMSGAFGTRAEGFNLFSKSEIKNTANAGMLWWEEKLMALWHFGKPYLVDPGSLGTVLGVDDSGATDLGGHLEDDVGFGPSPRVCATTGRLVNFAQAASPLGTTLTLFEFAPGWKPRYKFPRSFNVGGYTHFGDFAITPRWFVLPRLPLKADGIAAAMGKSFTDVLQEDAGGTTEFIFATRDKGGQTAGRGGGKEVTVPVDSVFCTEFANAYETEDGRVVADIVAADGWRFGPDSRGDGERPLWEVEDPSARPRTRLVRYEVDPATKAWSKRELCDVHMGHASVNPTVCGKPHRYVFCAVSHADAASGPFAGVAKIDVQSGAVDAWRPGPTEFGSEPLFVPRAAAEAEDDGYLLTTVVDGAAGRSDMVILDARRVSQGPICRFALQGFVPAGLRACWAEGLSFTEEDMKRKMVLLRMFKKKSTQWNAMNSSFSMLAGGAFFQKQGTAMR